MTVKIGINGLGRIGRMIVRSIVESKNKNIEIKHINNRTNSENSSPVSYTHLTLPTILLV